MEVRWRSYDNQKFWVFLELRWASAVVFGGDRGWKTPSRTQLIEICPSMWKVLKNNTRILIGSFTMNRDGEKVRENVRKERVH